MARYILRYWFEHGGTCLWSVNDDAKNKFDYAIDNDKLPISNELIHQLYDLEAAYHGYLNWDYPPDPSPWTEEQKLNFKNRANQAYSELLLQLGSDFEVINEIDKSLL